MTNLTDADLAAMEARAEDGKLHAAIVYLRDVRSLLVEVAALRKQIDLADKAPHEAECRVYGMPEECYCWESEYDAAKEASHE